MLEAVLEAVVHVAGYGVYVVGRYTYGVVSHLGALDRLAGELALEGTDARHGTLGGVPVRVEAMALGAAVRAEIGHRRQDARSHVAVAHALGVAPPEGRSVQDGVVTCVDADAARILELACLVAHLDPARPLDDGGSAFWASVVPTTPALRELTLGHRISSPGRAQANLDAWSEGVRDGSDVAIDAARRTHGLHVRPALRARADALIAAGEPAPTPLIEALAAHADDQDEARILDLLARAEDDAIFAGLRALRNFGSVATLRRLPPLATQWSRWVQDDVRTALERVRDRVGPLEVGALTLPTAPGELTTPHAPGALTQPDPGDRGEPT